MGSAVKALCTPRQNEFHRAVRILFHLIVPQSDDGPSKVFQKCRPPRIIVNGIGVLTPVQFDGKLRLSAGEIKMYGLMTS